MILLMAIPTYDNLFNPVIEALKKLGGSGSVSEIEEKVAVLLKLTDEEVNEIHRGNRSKLSYRLAWSRNYLKRYGILENSSRGVWALTPLERRQEKSIKTRSTRPSNCLTKRSSRGRKMVKKL